MSWWQILIAIFFTVPWIYVFVKFVIVDTVIDNRNYKKKYTKWNKEHPDLQRRECKTCKYAISETYWDGLGRYPNRLPRRTQTYCTLTKRKLSGNNSRCMIAEPPLEYFFESKCNIKFYPPANIEIYYSAYGNCYHSTPNCSSIKNSQNIYTNKFYIDDRYPCPKCWEEKGGVLYPKK